MPESSAPLFRTERVVPTVLSSLPDGHRRSLYLCFRHMGARYLMGIDWPKCLPVLSSHGRGTSAVASSLDVVRPSKGGTVKFGENFCVQLHIFRIGVSTVDSAGLGYF